MGDWNEKFGKTFRTLREDARLAEQRKHENSDLLKEKAPDLWNEFKDKLRAAASDISGSEGFLTYSAVAGSSAAEEVSLVCSLANGNRTATIELFSPRSVKLQIAEPGRSLLSKSYELAVNPKGDGVWFSENPVTGKTSEELVNLVLNGLSAAHQ